MLDARNGDAQFLQQRVNDPVGFGEQTAEKVQGLNLSVLVFAGNFLAAGERFLGFDGEFFESHIFILSAGVLAGVEGYSLENQGPTFSEITR